MSKDAWPLFGIRVGTPRIELRYVDDELAFELANLATRGVHDPTFMPFAVPWTDAEPEMLVSNTLKFYWNCRAQTEPNHWTLPFAVIEQGVVIGSSALNADDFPILRQFETGSWLGREYQGRGLGRELREATLHLGFLGLGARLAITGAYADNPPSLGVTRSLGYLPNGSGRKLRRGQAATHLDFELAVDDWATRLQRDDISIVGVEPCLQFLDLR